MEKMLNFIMMASGLVGGYLIADLAGSFSTGNIKSSNLFIALITCSIFGFLLYRNSKKNQKDKK